MHHCVNFCQSWAKCGRENRSPKFWSRQIFGGAYLGVNQTHPMRHGAIQLGISAILVSGIHEHHICSLTRRQQNACYLGVILSVFGTTFNISAYVSIQ